MTINNLGPVFRGSHAVAAGDLTPGQLRGPHYRRLCRDGYVPASVRTTHPLRCQAFALVLGDAAVITGRSAASVRGVPLAWPDDEVSAVAIPESRVSRRSGLDLRRSPLTARDWEPWAGGRLALPSRMALDLLLGRPLPEAVADLDAVLRAKLVTLPQVTKLVAGRSDKGILAARQAVALADPRAESLPESRLRVVLTLAGLTPVPQYWICDAHGRIARVDLAFPDHRVAVEYDGDWRDGEQWALNRDRERLNRVHAVDWDVVFVTAPLLRDERRLVRTVRAALN